MKGVRQRIKSDAEGQLATLHAAATFNALAAHGKLEPFRTYIEPVQSPAAMIAMLQTLGANSDMKIRKVEHGS